LAHSTPQGEQSKDTKLGTCVRIGQVKKVEKAAVKERVKFIAEIFGVVA